MSWFARRVDDFPEVYGEVRENLLLCGSRCLFCTFCTKLECLSQENLGNLVENKAQTVENSFKELHG